MRKLLILGVSIFFNSLFSQVDEKAYYQYLKEMSKEFTVDNIKATELKENYNLLDLRELAEYKVSHIKGAIQISFDDFKLDNVKSYSKLDTIVLYCSVGYRSSKIAETLKKNGFKHVFNLYGGIFNWVNKGRSIVKEENNNTIKTHKIHTYDKRWGRYMLNSDFEKVY